MLEDVGRKFDRRVVTALANYSDNRGIRESWKSFSEQPVAAEWAMATPAHVPDYTCVYAIGSIEGCARLLRKINDVICDDGKAKAVFRNVVYLSDYIDRVQNSSNVIELVLAGLCVA